MTNRVKPLEELPIKPNRKHIKEIDSNLSGHAHNDMLSPYSNIPRKSQSKSPRRQEFGRQDSVKSNDKDAPKELMDYLNSKNEIIYSELLCDEISKVDETLLKAAKKDRQVGGTYLIFLKK